MASMATRRRAAPAPVSHEDGVPAGTRQGKDAEDAALGHAAGGCSTAAAPEAAEPSEAYHLAKRPRPAVAAESTSDATVHDQQVVEDPPRGDAQRPTATSQVAKALKKLAQRIRTFPEGRFPPSPPPALLDRITDELLVISSDVVAGVAKDGQPLSANAALRLLAWTVADARGATVPLDGPLALTVGKRLDRQARSVRASLAEIHAGAEADRAQQRGSADADALPAALAAVDAAEAAEIQKVRDEVYVGFHELAALLPEAPGCSCSPAGSSAALASAASISSRDYTPYPPATSPVPAVSPHTAWTRELHEIGCYFPWKLVEDYEKEDGTIPPDLARALGPEATEALEARLGATSSCPMGFVGEKWWHQGLPLFVKLLLDDAAKRDELLSRSDTQLKKCDDALRESNEELEKLEGKLREAKGREDALNRVIEKRFARCMWK